METHSSAVRLVIYESGEGRTAARLREAMEGSIPSQIEIHQSIGGFSASLGRPSRDPGVAVILLKNRDDFRELLLIGTLLRRFRVLLVLPDQDPETIARGHTLRPRFMSHADGEFSDVVQVLEKMLGGSYFESKTG